MNLTPQDARKIEAECGLEPGSIAANREMTPAEAIYLQVPALPAFAIHVDHLPGRTSLVLYDQEVGESAKAHLRGASHATEEDATADIKRQWAGLQLVRMGGVRHLLDEDLAITMTGWVVFDPGQRFSWSIQPSMVRSLFQGACRAMLLGPRFGDVPPQEEGGESPGKCIQELAVDTVIYVHSFFFQGGTTLKNHDGGGLMDLAIAEQKARKQES